MYDGKIYVGHPVRLKPFHDDFFHNELGVDHGMIDYFGRTVTVRRLETCYTDRQWFTIEEDGGEWTWTTDWIVTKPEVKLPEDLFHVL